MDNPYVDATNLTKSKFVTKPKNSPNPVKWQKNGGKVSIDDADIWTYHHKDGHSVSYPDGYPDFKNSGFVIQEAKIGSFSDYGTDFANANKIAPNGPMNSQVNTWHHHQDGTTLQEINKEIHKAYTHRGGMSLKRKK